MLFPEGSHVTITEKGANIINSFQGIEMCHPGDQIIYSFSHQEEIGGTPLFGLPDGGFLAVPREIISAISRIAVPPYHSVEPELLDKLIIQGVEIIQLNEGNVND
jgi:hypothetical protein